MRTLLLAFVAASSILLACSGSDSSGPILENPGAILVVPDPMVLSEGASAQLEPLLLDSLGQPALQFTPDMFEWSSDNPAVASVSSSGRVTAKPGTSGQTAQVTTRYADVSTTTVIAVEAAATGAEVAPAAATITPGGQIFLTGKSVDAAGNRRDWHSFDFGSSDSSLLSLATHGCPLAKCELDYPHITLARALGTGTVTVTGLSDGRSGTATITIRSLPLASVMAGGTQSCGFTVDDALFCWGEAGGGLLTTTPHLVPGTSSLASVEASGQSICGLDATGAAWCWGQNVKGQLGDGTTVARSVPTPVAGGLTFTQLAMSNEYACGLTPAGAAYCWGDNRYGRLGDGTQTQRLVPTPVGGAFTFERIAAGYEHACGIVSGGAAYCWGRNFRGELGGPVPLGPCGAAECALSPVAVPDSGYAYTGIHAGLYVTCALTTTGKAFCWGAEESLGAGQGAGGAAGPVPVAGNHVFAALSGRGAHTCGLTPQGVALCWGANGSSQTGTPADQLGSPILVPAAVSGGRTYTSISAGVAHTCGMSGSKAYCWGDNAHGQAGVTQGNTSVPILVMGQE